MDTLARKMAKGLIVGLLDGTMEGISVDQGLRVILTIANDKGELTGAEIDETVKEAAAIMAEFREAGELATAEIKARR